MFCPVAVHGAEGHDASMAAANQGPGVDMGRGSDGRYCEFWVEFKTLCFFYLDFSRPHKSFTAHPTHHAWLRPDVLESPRVRSHYESLLAVMCPQLLNELTSNEKSPSSFLWSAPLIIKSNHNFRPSPL